MVTLEGRAFILDSATCIVLFSALCRHGDIWLRICHMRANSLLIFWHELDIFTLGIQHRHKLNGHAHSNPDIIRIIIPSACCCVQLVSWKILPHTVTGRFKFPLRATCARSPHATHQHMSLVLLDPSMSSNIDMVRHGSAWCLTGARENLLLYCGLLIGRAVYVAPADVPGSTQCTLMYICPPFGV